MGASVPIHEGSMEEAPLVFPTWLYKYGEEPQLVADLAAMEALGEGWVNRPWLVEEPRRRGRPPKAPEEPPEEETADDAATE